MTTTATVVPRNSPPPPEEEESSSPAKAPEDDDGGTPPHRRRQLELLSGGAIVVVAKCPIPGSPVKTRLRGLLGEVGSTSLARAMLCDVLEEVGSNPFLVPVRKVLLYAPGNDEGRENASELVSSINMSQQWTLLPMLTRWSSPPSSSQSAGGEDIISTDSSNTGVDRTEEDMRSPDLGDKLKDALVRVRAIQRGGRNGSTDAPTDSSQRNSPGTGGGGRVGGVVFLGMDSPEIDAVEIGGALLAAVGGDDDDSSEDDRRGGSAHLCPAEDGGYGMLCLPPTAPPDVFDGVRWSTSLTAVSQLKALGDCGVGRVRVGRLMRDVDEPDDVWDLARRLCDDRNNNVGSGVGCEEGNGVGDAPGAVDYGDVLRNGSYPSLREAWTRSDASGKQKADRCRHTWEQLIQLGLVRKVVNGSGDEQYVLNKGNEFP